MKTLNAALQAHIHQSATTLCWAWKITREDGAVLGFTDHDDVLSFDGVNFRPESGFTSGSVDQRLGFSTDTGAVYGALHHAEISDSDIEAWLYARATIESYRVNWQDPEARVRVMTGRLGTIRRRGGAFEAEWVGPGAALDRATGRVFSRLCDAELGDARCGLSREDFPTGTVCPRTFSACQNTFANAQNFRGFPYLLGDDALQAAPQGGEVFDGGSRYL